jgi:hypothetical protein
MGPNDTMLAFGDLFSVYTVRRKGRTKVYQLLGVASLAHCLCEQLGRLSDEGSVELCITHVYIHGIGRTTRTFAA